MNAIKKINPEQTSIILGLVVLVVTLGASLYLYLVTAAVPKVSVPQSASAALPVDLQQRGVFDSLIFLTKSNPQEGGTGSAPVYQPDDLGKRDISRAE